jgi:hypothetical protein
VFAVTLLVVVTVIALFDAGHVEQSGRPDPGVADRRVAGGLAVSCWDSARPRSCRPATSGSSRRSAGRADERHHSDRQPHRRRRHHCQAWQQLDGLRRQQLRIQTAAADELFLDYRDFENVRDNLVTRELRAALNEVFADFDPLAPENSDGANVQALGDHVAEKLRNKVGGQIEIINVIVPLVNYDQATQDRINALNVEKANTRVAVQRAKTAAAGAKANEILAASVTNDPNVLVSKCLDAAREAQLSPLGCWANTTAVPTVPAR